MNPFLSVYVPAWNAEKYIVEAIESVLLQLRGEVEVIVVDDGSSDGTVRIASQFGPPVRVVTGPHRGIAGTINAAMSEVRGQLIASIDADDRWLPGKLEAQLRALSSDPAIDAVFGYVRQFVSPEIAEGERSRYAFSGDPMPGLLRGVMLIRRQSLARVGSMETDLTVGEFVSWYARAVDAGLTMKMLPQVVYERRIHGANTVIRERDAATDYLRIVKATLDRRRGRKTP